MPNPTPFSQKPSLSYHNAQFADVDFVASQLTVDRSGDGAFEKVIVTHSSHEERTGHATRGSTRVSRRQREQEENGLTLYCDFQGKEQVRQGEWA
jgi:hypothetical protein